MRNTGRIGRSRRRDRLTWTTLLAGLLCALASSPASGTANAPLLQGRWAIAGLEVKQKNLVGNDSKHFRDRWLFFDQCIASRCITSSRAVEAGDAGLYILTYTRVAAEAWRGSAAFTTFGVCGSGRIIIGGYRYHVTRSLQVTDSVTRNGGSYASRIEGRYVIRGRQRRGSCHLPPTLEVDTFTGRLTRLSFG
jgi:hypothetical protein